MDTTTQTHNNLATITTTLSQLRIMKTPISQNYHFMSLTKRNPTPYLRINIFGQYRLRHPFGIPICEGTFSQNKTNTPNLHTQMQ